MKPHCVDLIGAFKLSAGRGSGVEESEIPILVGTAEKFILRKVSETVIVRIRVFVVATRSVPFLAHCVRKFRDGSPQSGLASAPLQK